MAREITTHKVTGCNEALMVRAMDEPGNGGANHEYQIEIDNDRPDCILSRLPFQNGPIKEVGTNGITHEALLAILIDRMQAFQKGPFSCRENAIALTHLEDAMHWLNHRTRARLIRGVEGTHTV